MDLAMCLPECGLLQSGRQLQSHIQPSVAWRGREGGGGGGGVGGGHLNVCSG